MVAVASVVCAAPVARPVATARPAASISKPSVSRQFALPARAAKPQRRAAAVQPKALAGLNEVAQLAEIEAGFIWGVAGVMCAMTLIGLAVGFVILRVESLAEEGKI